MNEILTGIERAAGMLFVGWVIYASYKISRDFAEKKRDITSWKRYIFVISKWILAIALIALVAASIAGKGGCDSFDNCMDPDPNPAPLTETWTYFFVLLLVPAMIGLHRTETKS
ncbi:MAG: hypothetical protein LiPW15_617 [Parcubacteria group bacterium LiPW_15]|nr:MAG: hypothetical protein LiPW15_617 [Parcubacteria group bacterium LiPW_15]